MKPKFKLAVVQIRTETDDKAERMIGEAANNGAELVVLPEMWNCPYSKKYFHAFADSENGESREAMSRWARENGVILVGGSVPEKCGDKLYNTCFVLTKTESRSRATGKCICLTSISRAECALKSPTALHPARISRCSIQNSAEWALRSALISVSRSLHEPWPKGEPRSFCALRSLI